MPQNRRRRFTGTDIEQRIFDAIVEQAIEHGLVGGRVFYSDSTYLKASRPTRPETVPGSPHDQSTRYREYRSQVSECAACSVKGQCTNSRAGGKLVTRHIWQYYKDAIDANRLSDKGKELYKRRKEAVERSFADAKELHGHRYARFRGLAKVRAQALLAAACQNMKKMARLLEQALRLLFARIAPFILHSSSRRFTQALFGNFQHFAHLSTLFLKNALPLKKLKKTPAF